MAELSVHVMLKPYSAKFIEDLQISVAKFILGHGNLFCEMASNAV